MHKNNAYLQYMYDKMNNINTGIGIFLQKWKKNHFSTFANNKSQFKLLLKNSI